MNEFWTEYAQILFVYLVITTLSIISIVKRYLKRKNEIELYKFNMTLKIEEDIESRLDFIIETCFQEYSLAKLVNASDWYISENEEIEINKDINNLVAQRLSPILMDQLSIYYMKSEIPNIIAKRVYYRVTNFVIEHNRSYKS